MKGSRRNPHKNKGKNRNKKISNMRLRLVLILTCLCIALYGGAEIGNHTNQELAGEGWEPSGKEVISLSDIPDYSKEPYIVINGNIPDFQGELPRKSFEEYEELDALGRCGMAFACIGQDIMPTEDRGRIGQVKPTGWHTMKYEIVDGNYLYNRCHLIGYQLTGENVNRKNLITGTRSMNVDGMLPFENMVADYVKETNHHVLYRVTPIFSDQDLLARGVQIEGYSVEDQGEAICFNVFVYNAQDGIFIDYETGDSHLE